MEIKLNPDASLSKHFDAFDQVSESALGPVLVFLYQRFDDPIAYLIILIVLCIRES